MAVFVKEADEREVYSVGNFQWLIEAEVSGRDSWTRTKESLGDRT